VLPFPGVGGTEIATRRIIDAVLPFGVENSALLLRPTEEQAAYLRAAGVPIVIPRVVPEPSFRRALRFMFDSHTLARAFMDVDLIHCADVPGAYYAAVAGRLAGVPVLAHVRNRHPRSAETDDTRRQRLNRLQRLIPAAGSSDVCSAVGPRLWRQRRSVRSYRDRYQFSAEPSVSANPLSCPFSRA
jgi:hypothetical protein